MSENNPLISNKSKVKQGFNPLYLGGILTFAFLIILGILFIPEVCEKNSSDVQVCTSKFRTFLESSPNEIGDALAGIFSTLAFLWIIVTVLMQKRELEAQREALFAQKDELKYNRLESEKMADALAEQVFDNSFFAMLTTFNGIIADIDVGRDGDKSGRDAFMEFYNSLHYVNGLAGTRLNKIEEVDKLAKPLEKFFQGHSKELSHYFRFIFRILTTLEQKDKVDSYHAKLLRAQISDYELIIIYYNCLTQNGKAFINLAEKFALFDNIPTDKLLNIEHCAALHSDAFGSNRGYWEWHEGKNP